MEALLHCEVRRCGVGLAAASFGAPLPGSLIDLRTAGSRAARILLGRELASDDEVRALIVPDREILNLDAAFDGLIEAAESAADYPLANAVIALRTAWSRGRSLDAARAILRASGAGR